MARLDDDLDLHPAARDEFVAKRRASGAATLLAWVDPGVGVTPADLDSVESWLASLGRP